MFREACKLASNFTLPVVLSQRTVAGVCASSIGAFVVVNRAGWIVTAGHVLEQASDQRSSVEAIQTRLKREQEIRSDKTIDEKERRARLRALGQSKPTDVDRSSAFWGGLPGNPQITTYAIVRGVDLGVAKLEPFDPASVAAYPVFKDPSRTFDPGTSLCKLGFPFHVITPIYHQGRDAFELPAGALPIPFFPIDGMFTRRVQVAVQDVPNPEIQPLLWVETSTPGLRGQSGGPTFDSRGTVWAIQSRTSSLPLGFTSEIPDQFLHVGLGVHPATIFAVFDKLGVEYQSSDY
jgi:hypothetical protein